MWHKSLCMAGLLFIYATRAQAAVTIDFNSVPSVGNPILTALTTQGFDFTSSHFHTIDTTNVSFGGTADNGTIFIFEEAGSLGFPITMAPSGGGTFSLTSFDGAEAWVDAAAALAGGFPNAAYIDVVGNLFGGGTVGALFQLDGIIDGPGGAADFETFVLPATFTNLVSVVFSGAQFTGAPGGIALDNITVNGGTPGEVPEPASLVVWSLLGLATLWQVRRRASR